MPERHPANLHVITGGPGAGKTALIEALATAGYAHSEEAGRRIIRDQMAISGPALPWQDRSLYAELQLSFEMQSYTALVGNSGPVFFDRGIPDVIGYMRLEGLPVPDHLVRAAERFRYAGRVFLCPPWSEIYDTDSERKQTLEIAERTCDAMIAAYSGLGYALLEVPRVSVAERVRFVLDAIPR